MIRLSPPRWLACLALVAMGLLPEGHASAAAQQPVLIPTPSYGRPNDVFYLAGGRFPPNEQISVTMFCNNWYEDFYGHWTWTIKTDQHGAFTGAKLGVPTPQLVDVKVRSTSCVLYAPDGGNLFGVAAPFTVLPTSNPTPQREFSIRVHVTVAQSGGRWIETVKADSAPGAALVFTVTYPGNHRATYKVRMPWTGHLVTHWSVPLFVSRTLYAKLRVSGSLGDLKAQTTTQFLVRR